MKYGDNYHVYIYPWVWSARSVLALQRSFYHDRVHIREIQMAMVMSVCCRGMNELTGNRSREENAFVFGQKINH